MIGQYFYHKKPKFTFWYSALKRQIFLTSKQSLSFLTYVLLQQHPLFPAPPFILRAPLLLPTPAMPLLRLVVSLCCSLRASKPSPALPQDGGGGQAAGGGRDLAWHRGPPWLARSSLAPDAHGWPNVGVRSIVMGGVAGRESIEGIKIWGSQGCAPGSGDGRVIP
jgi:hypothetical protein